MTLYQKLVSIANGEYPNDPEKRNIYLLEILEDNMDRLERDHATSTRELDKLTELIKNSPKTKFLFKREAVVTLTKTPSMVGPAGEEYYLISVNKVQNMV